MTGRGLPDSEIGALYTKKETRVAFCSFIPVVLAALHIFGLLQQARYIFHLCFPSFSHKGLGAPLQSTDDTRVLPFFIVTSSQNIFLSGPLSCLTISKASAISGSHNDLSLTKPMMAYSDNVDGENNEQGSRTPFPWTPSPRTSSLFLTFVSY